MFEHLATCICVKCAIAKASQSWFDLQRPHRHFRPLFRVVSCIRWMTWSCACASAISARSLMKAVPLSFYSVSFEDSVNSVSLDVGIVHGATGLV